MSAGVDPRVFHDAAQLIREHGLAKLSYEDTHGRFCTVGALLRAKFPGKDWLRSAIEVGSETVLLAELLGGPLCSDDTDTLPGFDTVTRWNDDAETVADEVVDLLERAERVALAARPDAAVGVDR